MKNKFYASLIVFTLSILIVSCSGDDSAGEQKIIAESGKKNELTIHREVLDEMMQSLPQPIEIADIITKSNMPFSKEMLVPSENSESYPDKYYQSLAFGAYGVDLGYINLNDKKLFVLEYLEAIRNLSDELKVGQFFDFQTLYEITKNRHNADSLIHISTKNFNKIDEFLREENRGELSVLMLVGAWLEGMHMFGQIEKKQAGEDIKKRIGEQKIVFDNVMAILDKLSKVEHFKKMKTDFEGLKKAYSEVKISYIYHDPETKEVNGELVIVDKTETKVEITDQGINDIISHIEKIRTSYLLNTKK
ncbi:MAG: hypothetical protein JST26_16680 [Bacteroidetes bacterium]|nr:hypothetical protein [Bacteroidota bacterium]